MLRVLVSRGFKVWGLGSGRGYRGLKVLRTRIELRVP